jgi:plasmid stabilization system protein ParE
MKVHWSNTAIEHLSKIHDYVAQDSPHYANKLIDRITRRSEQFEIFPRSGRIVPEFGSEEIREVVEGSYRIIYYIGLQQIDILAVVNTAQNLGFPQKSEEN